MSAASAGLISGRLVMGVHAEHGGEDGAGPGRRRLEAQPGIAVDRAVEGDRLQVEAAVDLGAGIGLALDDERPARQMIEVAAVLKPLRMGLVQDEAEIGHTLVLRPRRAEPGAIERKRTRLNS